MASIDKAAAPRGEERGEALLPALRSTEHSSRHRGWSSYGSLIPVLTSHASYSDSAGSRPISRVQPLDRTEAPGQATSTRRDSRGIAHNATDEASPESRRQHVEGRWAVRAYYICCDSIHGLCAAQQTGRMLDKRPTMACPWPCIASHLCDISAITWRASECYGSRFRPIRDVAIVFRGP